ncbi:MFS transporter [Streptomyces sp. NPDC017673]|uniref:MFS transporter n=1 Tax=unclassified Streptomyces TaxID=2593676 RepID=UPI0037A71778
MSHVSRGKRLGSGFRRAWAAVVVSGLGDGLRLVSLPLLAAQLTDDPVRTAMVSLAEQLPWLLLGPVAGALADRFDRRGIMAAVDSGRAVVAGSLAFAVAAHMVSVPALAVFAFLLGCGFVLHGGAWSGLVPTLVPPEARASANARLHMGALTSNTLIGTPLGSVVFAVSAALPFALDAVSFGLAALLVMTLSGDFRPRAAGGPKPTAALLRRDTVEGVRWLWRHRQLRRLCLVTGICNLVGVGVISVLVLYARNTLGMSGFGYSLLLAGSALGAVAGAAVTPRMVRWAGPGRLLRLALVGGALSVVATGAAPWGLAAGCGIAVYGAVNAVWNVTVLTQRQSLVPNVLLGRVTVAYQMVTGCASALGAATGGLAAHAFGLRAPFLTGGVLLLVAALISPRLAAGASRSTGSPSDTRPGARDAEAPVEPSA